MKITTQSSINPLIAVATATFLCVCMPAAMANGGKLNFAGNVSDETCNVSVNGLGDGDTAVTLPTISKNLLKLNGNTAGRTFLNFSISGCNPASGAVHIYFAAGATINGSGRLVNTTTVGQAANVELQMLNPSLAVMNLAAADGGQLAGSAGQVGADGSLSITHAVQYYATAPATAGQLTSSVQYELSYE